MKIAVDAMGGDEAPGAVVEGAVMAGEQGTSVLLVGDRDRIEREISRVGGGSNLEIVHTDEVVGMDEPAITPIRKKRRASVRICAELVREGRADAMVSAGNTGATMIVAKMVIGTVPGVDRPALAVVLPTARGRSVLLDVGANIDSKSAQLREFAVMGHAYAREVLRTEAPKVGLLSIGEEEGKGTELTREGFKVLQGTGLNFVGNVEPRDLFEGEIDVVVCDGFVGNVLLKSAESLVTLVGDMIREELTRSLGARLGALFFRPAFERLRHRTHYEEVGAAPLLGINGACFIAHGRSTPRAVRSAIGRAVEASATRLHRTIAVGLATLHDEEARFLKPPTPRGAATG